MQRLLHQNNMQPQHRKMRILHKTQMHNKRNPKTEEKNMTNNNEKNIANLIQNQIQNTINTQPHPTKATITKTYTNGNVDITTQYGTLRNIKSITTHTVGDETLLIFLDNTYELKMVI